MIYNDYDDYHLRLDNIDRTNALISNIRTLIGHYPKSKKLTAEIKVLIMNLVIKADAEGYVDYITLSSQLLFSSKYVVDIDGLRSQTFYNNIINANYNCDSYLDGIEIVQVDYRQLFNKYKDVSNVVFLIDPPYLSTEVGVYKCRWKLSDYLDVLSLLNDTSYFYFTSNKSSIIELCEWIAQTKINANPFDGAVKKEIRAQLNYNSKYTDIMLYRQQ